MTTTLTTSDGGHVALVLSGVPAPTTLTHETLAHVEVLQPLHGAVQGLGVGGGDDLTLLNPPGAVHVDGVVRTKGVPGVGDTLM